jgi:hypothetical protein
MPPQCGSITAQSITKRFRRHAVAAELQHSYQTAWRSSPKSRESFAAMADLLFQRSTPPDQSHEDKE